MKVKWQMAWLYLNEFWEASIALGMEKVTTLLQLKFVLMTSLFSEIVVVASSVTASTSPVGLDVSIDISSSEAKGGPTKKSI